MNRVKTLVPHLANIHVSFECAKMVENRIKFPSFENWDVVSYDENVSLVIYGFLSMPLRMIVEDYLEDYLVEINL